MHWRDSVGRERCHALSDIEGMSISYDDFNRGGRLSVLGSRWLDELRDVNPDRRTGIALRVVQPCPDLVFVAGSDAIRRKWNGKATQLDVE